MEDATTQAIRRIQDRYYAQVERIRANQDLSDQGRRKALAGVYRRALADIAARRDQAAQRTASRRAQLEKVLFAGAGRDALSTIAYRDALDRVAQLSRVADAQAMLRRAVRHGDTTLAMAVFSHAVDQARGPLGSTSWGAVVREYVDTVRPDLAPALQEYERLLAGDTRTARLEQQITTSISRPAELAGLTNGEVERLAEQAAEPADHAPPEHDTPIGHVDATPDQVRLGAPVVANVPTS